MQTTRKKMSIYMAAATAVALPTVLFTIGAQPAIAAAPVNHIVATKGDTFSPSVLPGTVAIGDTVTFSGLSGHNATSTTGSAATFASPAGVSTFVYKATNAGKFTYECTFHSGMTGSFTVAAVGAAPAPPTAAAPTAAAPAADPSAKGDDADDEDDADHEHHGDHGDHHGDHAGDHEDHGDHGDHGDDD
jgi:plastocyanin